MIGTGPFGLRRSALVTAPLVFLAIIGGAFAVAPQEPSAKMESPRPPAANTLRQAPPAPAAGGGAAVIEEAKPKKPVLARVEAKPEPKVGAPGRLELAVAPWGEVVVDGKSRGLSPPLRVMELAPGAHKIEIRNSTFPAHVAQVELKPGEAIRIQHRFR